MNTFPYTDKLKPFQDADDAWSAELRRVFGKEACHARYEPRGRGVVGSELRRLHDERDWARTQWHQSAVQS